MKRVIRMINNFLREKKQIFARKVWDRKVDKPEIKYGNFIEENNINSIVFLRYDGKIGDMVVNTLLFREIKKRYPHIKIGVVTRGEAKSILAHNPYVDALYEFKKGKERQFAKEIAIENYDVLVDFSEFLRANEIKFVNLCKARINIGVDKDNWNLFDISYKKDKDAHITKSYKNILKIFDIESSNNTYDIFITDKIKKKVEKKLINIGKYIILNPYGASKHRCFSVKKIVEIIDYCLKKCDCSIVLIGEKGRQEELRNIVKKYKIRVYYIEFDGILEVAEAIKMAEYLITPDTSIVHIGVAMETPMTAIYREDIQNDKNSIIWSPNFDKAKLIFAKKQNGESEVDINNFDVEKVL